MKFTIRILLFFSITALAACAAETVRPTVHSDVVTVPVETEVAEIYAIDPAIEGSMPAHLVEASVRIAILLPLSGDKKDLGKALLGAASMALFDAYDPRITLIPFDTKASAEGAAEAAVAALEANVDLVLGPLFSESIMVVGPLLAKKNITMIGFSSDRRVAGLGQFIMGFAPEDEVNRVMAYAVKQGHNNFAALIPKGLYGQRVLKTIGNTLEVNKARLMAMEEYPPSADSVFEPIKKLADYTARKGMRDAELLAMKAIDSDVGLDIIKDLQDKEVLGDVNFSAILIPEGGQLLRTIAPLLPYYEVDPVKVQFLGTGLWNDSSVLREPPLEGAWFAAPEPEKPAEFMRKYEAIYGEAPPRIATLAYDAMALVALRMRHPINEERYSTAALLDMRGFQGIDGLFRFKEDGTVERSLAILEITKKGFVVIEKAPHTFPRFGAYVIRPVEK